MALGHWLRDAADNGSLSTPPATAEKQVDVLIIGSGPAGLTAAWNLKEAGVKNFAVLTGPEEHGNAAGLKLANLACPTGAHYLPLPSIESIAVRQILASMGVMQGAMNSERPSYDETVIVHSPSERVFFEGQWQYGLLPIEKSPQRQKFLDRIAAIAKTLGSDGLRLFTVPIALSSRDLSWRKLDTLTFSAWLRSEGFNDEHLLSYLDYCCRDEYGIGLALVSAWAGLHYFCSRSGHASNAEDGAVLTWSDGLSPVLRFLEKDIKNTPQWLKGSAMKVQRMNAFVAVPVLHENGSVTLIKAKRVVMATPLYVSARLDAELAIAYKDLPALLPAYQPWLVSNFLFNFSLPETSGADLSWDNVVHLSKNLGYINARHQEFTVANAAATPQLFTAYHAMADAQPIEARRWLAQASDKAVLQLAATDMVQVYGSKFWSHLQSAHLTLRAHGMPGPRPGYLSNRMLSDLGAETGQVIYANADLSGYSVFEEAAFWGQRAAKIILG
jgi:FAD binding domain